MNGLILSLVAFAAAFPVAAAVLLRSPIRRRQALALDVFLNATFLLGAFALRSAWPEEPSVLFSAFAVLKVGGFCLVWLSSPDGEARWSPTVAAVVAGIIYLLLVPSMLRAPIDGDEPFYVLITESLIHDRDLDLRNQYARIADSAVRRPDLKPQFRDPVGPGGEQYSRHKPFLSVLLIPGYLAAGLPGAVATIAIFGALTVRSTLRLFEEEGISTRTARFVFPLLAFGPPLLYYATRIWPEVPAAFFFVESIRAARGGVQRAPAFRLGLALLALSLLKLRFLLIVVMIILAVAFEQRRNWRRVAVVVLLVAVPFGIAWMTVGRLSNVHEGEELLGGGPIQALRGLFGLVLDGEAGIAFQAPLYLLGIAALVFWRRAPGAFRLGCWSAALYLFALVPREEWHGGWSPPLRYLVVFMPILALGAASILDRHPLPSFRLFASLWTVGLVIHGAGLPWRKFHLANGENRLGEFLSKAHGADFSRLLPSFIRLNAAALVASILFLGFLAAFALMTWHRATRGVSSRASDQGSGRWLYAGECAAIILLLTLGFAFAMQPGRVVHFEDAHVTHEGGELYPPQWTVARFRYTGGWELGPGDRLTFRVRPGHSRLYYRATDAATIESEAERIELAPTAGTFQQRDIAFGASAPRGEIRCVRGRVILDRIEHE